MIWRRRIFCLPLILLLRFDGCSSLNDEGLALLDFRSKIYVDPYGAFKNWDSKDNDPCTWSGVHCIDSKVDILNLQELSLGGTLAPELGKLSHLRSLILYKNNFSGAIPKEIGQLTMLELLDLRGNNLSGTIPAEIGEMISLRDLFLCDEKFGISMPLIESVHWLSQLKCDQDLSFNMVMDTDCINRKTEICIQLNPLQQPKDNSFVVPIKGKVLHYFAMLPWLQFRRYLLPHGHGENDSVNIPSFPEHGLLAMNYARRKLLQESTNLAAAPITSSPPQEAIDVPSIGSGAFPAVPNSNVGQHPPTSSSSASKQNQDSSTETESEEDGESNGTLKMLLLVLPIVALVGIFTVGVIVWRCCRGQANIAVKTGLSGPLQKALVTGVPKLNRSELEAACEEFSNIIHSLRLCTVYKGTLSSGVEIAVVSTALKSENWSKRAQSKFRKKVDMLSRINNKNFTNLLGYCEENEPFTRMMTFEYASNATLYDHLHGKEYDHLDWSSRMRIIMGTAYCLQYIHHELNPPVVLANMTSKSIYLTDDYSAKVTDRNMWAEIADEVQDSPESPSAKMESSIYSFGIIMLEAISGKLPHSEEQGSILNWATEFLNDKSNFKNLVDPTLKTFEKNELEIACEVIQECIHADPKLRPSMKEIVDRLKEATGISAEAAQPRLSPLWWAELEILSGEAS